MIWPDRLLDRPPAVVLEPDYFLRTFAPGDEAAWIALMTRAGFPDWDEERLTAWLPRVLPDGLFLAIHRPTGQVVATAMAVEGQEELHPHGGELGWVAADPAHRGHGLGRAVCSAVVARLLEAGYRRIFLKTDDWRLPALVVYLRLGFVPFPYAEDMPERWRKVYEALGWTEI
jgi:mycothiol synthase